MERDQGMGHVGRRWHRRELVCVAMLGVAVLAGCSSDSKGTSDTNTPSVPSAESTTTQPTSAPTTEAPATAVPATTAPAATEPETTAPVTTAPATTAPATTAAATTTPVTTALATTAPATTIVSEPGPLEFVDGKLLGIAQGTSLTFAADTLGIEPVRLNDVEFDPPVFACTGTPDPWMIRTGGLTLVFEAFEGEEPILSNWTYTGGPAAGYSEIVAPFDVRIGDPRGKLEEANPDFAGYGDEVHVGTPFYLRYYFENDVLIRFGIIDCLFETEGEGP